MPTKIGFLGSWASIISLVITIHAIFKPEELKPTDKLTISQNPTTLTIKDVQLRKFANSDKEYVTLIIQNNSTVEALNVTVKTITDEKELFADKDDAIKPFYVNHRKIPANGEAIFPLASVKDFTQTIYPNKPETPIVRFGFRNKEENPFEGREKVCGNLSENEQCSFDTRYISTAIKINYDSIFGEKIQKLTQFRTYFLDSDVNKASAVIIGKQ